MGGRVYLCFVDKMYDDAVPCGEGLRGWAGLGGHFGKLIYVSSFLTQRWSKSLVPEKLMHKPVLYDMP